MVDHDETRDARGGALELEDGFSQIDSVLVDWSGTYRLGRPWCCLILVAAPDTHSLEVHASATRARCGFGEGICTNRSGMTACSPRIPGLCLSFKVPGMS